MLRSLYASLLTLSSPSKEALLERGGWDSSGRQLGVLAVAVRVRVVVRLASGETTSVQTLLPNPLKA